MSVPSDSVNYQPHPPAVPASSYTVENSPVAGVEWLPSGFIEINVPRQENAFLDGQSSYLMFDLENYNAAANDLSLDGHASSVIESIVVSTENGSKQLERVNNYNKLWCLLSDLQQSESQVGHSAVCEGCASDAANNVSRRGVTIAQNATKTFSIPLMLGTIGSLQQKYFPLGSLRFSGITLRINLADARAGMVAAAAAATLWRLKNVRFVASLIQVQPDVFSAITSASKDEQGQLVVPCESYAGFQGEVRNAALVSNNILSMSYSGLRTVFACLQASAVGLDADGYSITQRNRAQMDEYQFKIGTDLVPQTPVKAGTQSFSELMRSLQEFSDADSTGRITDTTYNTDDPAAAVEGCFALGLETESFQRAGDRLSQLGMNTIGKEVTLITRYSAAVAADQTLYAWAHHDLQVKIAEDGTAQVEL